MTHSAIGLTADELLTTTRSVRRRLDLDRPVEPEVLTKCLELALQAPSGSNRQAWHWVFVTDPAAKDALADLYREGFAAAYGPEGVGEMTGEQWKMWESARFLADNFGRVPVILIPCQWGRPDQETVPGQAGYWGSLLPAVWSFQLALRSRGLGSAWTTLHLSREQEAAALLGIPYERCAQAAMIPIAYTKGLDFRPGPRKPTTDIVHWDHW
jgi:nitroreductase